MAIKCKNCGEPIARFPLKDNAGKILWKNLFKISWDSVLLFVIIVALIITYKYDIAKCEEMIEDPLGYCEKTNACKILEEQQFIDPAGVNVFDRELIINPQK